MREGLHSLPPALRLHGALHGTDELVLEPVGA